MISIGISGRGVQHIQNFRPVFRLFMSTGSKIMSTRTIADIEADITTVKNLYPNWLADAGHTALITAYIIEKTALSAPAPAPGNYLHPVNSIEPFPSHLFHICILLLDEFKDLFRLQFQLC